MNFGLELLPAKQVLNPWSLLSAPLFCGEGRGLPSSNLEPSIGNSWSTGQMV